MFSTPLCPALVVGRPFLQLDYGRSCWATDHLSAAGLRAWLRLLTYFRNDRLIPRLSTRELARIAGLALSTAHKVAKELAPVLRFAGEADDELEDPAIHETNASPRNERGCSPNERNRSGNEHKRSENERPSLSLKEEIQEGITPPPTSSSRRHRSPSEGSREEEDGISGVRIRDEQGEGQQPALQPALAEAMRDQCLRVTPQLAAVSDELLAFWSGKEGNRTPLAFAALQAELCRIEADPAGGIEQVREQLSVAAQKGWHFIRHKTWHAWRLAHPEPIHLSEEDLTAGGIYPELAAFERRYRATYNPKASGGEVFGAYWNYTERLKREQAAPDLQSAA
ncbi:hypothetical protein KBY93_12345 [Synechococcus sp. J7-Johnson]|uniref:hypothetical protein n=1 Tax=Synechococcus sp. J7-Johnson TaxID=2823737 RepID=UPI0020CF7BC3|nr:hypothetical protein [Synechococcus sp. J7-Johnson]MCP9841417.1 hypothetical protein [Synechococcus sp. J7-Johnson]